jgi:hypothetical protein
MTSWPALFLSLGAAAVLCCCAPAAASGQQSRPQAVPGANTRSEAPERLASGTRQLSFDELRALVNGVRVLQVVPPELTWSVPIEHFQSDGSYIAFDHRDKHRGRYSIEKNTVCVETKYQPKFCRFVYVDTNRRYWWSKSKSLADFVLVELTNVERIEQ